MSGTFSTTEQEIIALKAILEMINDMVNYQMLTNLVGSTDVSLLPTTETHQRLFNILLVDFLSAPRPFPDDLLSSPARAGEIGYLANLEVICLNPQLDPSRKDALEMPLHKFLNWLNYECVVPKVWLPSIGKELDLKVRRIDFIKICGNISKHSFPRLGGNVKRLTEIFKSNSVIITDNQSYLVLPEFYEWFHDDILNYHLTTLSELLNEIRWGIHEYLFSEFQRLDVSIRTGGRSSHKLPSECNAEIAKSMYWDLMNFVQQKPNFPRFETSKYLKMRY